MMPGRCRIVIQHKVDSFDAQQNPVENWSNWQEMWAEKTALFGQEYYAAKAVGEEQTVIFKIRRQWSADQMNTVEYRLLYDGKAYDIKHIDHLPGHKWVKIRAIERPGIRW